MNRYARPVPWLVEEMELLKETIIPAMQNEIAELKAEVKRLEAEKASRRGRKPAQE